ncbi:hypothetical protein [Streptomyces xanthophaeus]|uniref:hypothetical protein n=1 Tax=Streptomyces xanthophaeus TaxID=67385 RepID=UPI00371BE808
MKITKFTPGLLALAATGALLAVATPAHASIDDTDSGPDLVVNDKSVKLANFDENTSLDQAFSNARFF